ncbi:hypothetical protein PQO01_08775 [Lentisphaera marina]|uniref:hypothetical protein n=1 Tax=Lentisphaera marina TaxID=1111041 RepID=UPI002365AFCE|nr:hypothetical protein [Lentisphaera marina]MDD7985039.1 hypothetical protein [Lentisphaera marina]
MRYFVFTLACLHMVNLFANGNRAQHLYALTDSQLEHFFKENGGESEFPDFYKRSLKALLYAEDDIEAGDYESAGLRVEKIFTELPISSPKWQKINFRGVHIGTPSCYASLRMIQQIVTLKSLDNKTKGSLQITAVIAPHAKVQRVTLPNLEIENVNLKVSPEILADDYKVLHTSTKIFRHWLKVITKAKEVNLKVHLLSEGTQVMNNDNGKIITSYPKARQMIDQVPEELKDSTDMWWVIAPSGVPGDGSGFKRHFITGGMTQYKGQALFLSDDAWFTRKPVHLGKGEYTTVEIRAYQPQWFQHEFMHHIYKKWPRFNLEKTGHSWFSRETWPQDFKGIYEPDYYYESISKRLINATPELYEGIKAPKFLKLRKTDLQKLVGEYHRIPIENKWHEVEIVQTNGQLFWRNSANFQWSLKLVEGELWTQEDCPYKKHQLHVRVDSNGQITAIQFGNGTYTKL